VPAGGGVPGGHLQALVGPPATVRTYATSLNPGRSVTPPSFSRLENLLIIETPSDRRQRLGRRRCPAAGHLRGRYLRQQDGRGAARDAAPARLRRDRRHRRGLADRPPPPLPDRRAEHRERTPGVRHRGPVHLGRDRTGHLDRAADAEHARNPRRYEHELIIELASTPASPRPAPPARASGDHPATPRSSRTNSASSPKPERPGRPRLRQPNSWDGVGQRSTSSASGVRRHRTDRGHGGNGWGERAVDGTWSWWYVLADLDCLRRSVPCSTRTRFAAFTLDDTTNRSPAATRISSPYGSCWDARRMPVPQAPQLVVDDVLACLRYAADLTNRAVPADSPVVKASDCQESVSSRNCQFGRGNTHSNSRLTLGNFERLR
jgi:hypothetical protein